MLDLSNKLFLSSNGGDYGQFAQVVNKNNIKTLFEHYAQADHHHGNQFFFDDEVTIHNREVSIESRE